MDPSEEREWHNRNIVAISPWQLSAKEDFERRKRAVSDQRAKICVMNRDAINAGLWALAGFDPALVHFAELREHLAQLHEDHPTRVSLDRALSVYLEGQRQELLHVAGITSDDSVVFDNDDYSVTMIDVVTCTPDPLGIEIQHYALLLGVLTAHGNAPWKRFAAVMRECKDLVIEDLAGAKS